MNKGGMMQEAEYSQRDIEVGLQDGQQHLARHEYEKAEECFAQAHRAALALKATSRLNELDQVIRSARDRARWYAQLAHESSTLAHDTDPATQLAGLSSMGKIIGQMTAMGYHETATLARSARRAVITSLDLQQIPELAQKAMENQDYATVVELLEGTATVDNSPAYSLLQRAERILQTDVEARVTEATQFYTQSRPLDGLATLQDLRRAHPNCPAWREPWFMLACAQGTFLLEHGRQSMSEAQYAAARSSFKEALTAFELGAEAYPGTNSTQMLLAEAQDLYEIAGEIGNAHTMLESGEEIAALNRFDTVQAKLEELAKEGREYSLIQYEIGLIRQRLSLRVKDELAARALLEEGSAAIRDGNLDRAAEFLAQVRSAPPDILFRLTAPVKEFEAAIEEQRLVVRAQIDELETLTRRDPVAALRHWMARSTEQPNLGGLPPFLLDRVLELTAGNLQQREWTVARQQLDLLRAAGVDASQLINLETVLVREQQADEAIDAFRLRFLDLSGKSETAAECGTLEKEIEAWLLGTQQSTRHSDGLELLAEVRQACELHERAAARQALSNRLAVLQERLASAGDETEWRSIIVDGAALEPQLTDSEENTRCRALIDQARSTLLQLDRARQVLHNAHELIAEGELEKAIAALSEVAPAAPGNVRAEIESLLQVTRGEQSRKQRLRHLSREIRRSIEAGKWDQAQEDLAEGEGLGLGSEGVTLDKIIQAGLRMAAGRQLLEQGEADLAIPRLKSAVSLAKNLPGAEVVLADAQAWLKRATEKAEQLTRQPRPAQEVETISIGTIPPMPGADDLPVAGALPPEMMTRLIRWIIEIEPIVIQARAAFLCGNDQLAVTCLLSLSRSLESQGMEKASFEEE